MKKLKQLILWAFLAFSLPVQSQIIDSIGPQGYLDTVMSGLDRGLISTGLLFDKTQSPFIPLNKYDGVIDTPISFNDILDIPFVLRNMSVGSIIIPDEDEIKLTYSQHNRNQLIVPFTIDYEYNKISDSAFILGLIDSTKLVWSDTLIGGKSGYEIKVLKTMAFNYSLLQGNTLKFMYDPRLYLTNMGFPKRLSIDFGDGLGLQIINQYDTVSISYSSYGDHEITIYRLNEVTDEYEKIAKTTITTSEGSSTSSYTDCSFKFISNQTVYKYTNTQRITGYDNAGNAIIEFVSTPTYVEAHIAIQMGRDKASGEKHSCLKKPLIFVDGINFGYQNHIDEFFSNANKCNELGFENIAMAIDFNPITGKKEPDTRFAHGPDFIKKATDAGYDIIFFDMLYGAADIKLNGLLLEEFITRLNGGTLTQGACYCGKTYDELVIIGASMGGQVSRYALLDMEQNNIQHCVREWVSFDSPNTGGNIALGLQSFVEWSANNNKKSFNMFRQSVENLNGKLDRDASKQLLIYHHTEKSNSLANPEFYAFYSKMNQMGSYPKKCRISAIACGSLNSTKQDYGFNNSLGYDNGAPLAELYLPTNILRVTYSFYAKIIAESGNKISANSHYTGLDPNKNYVFAGSTRYNAPPLSIGSNTNVSFTGTGYDNAPGGSNSALLSLESMTTFLKIFRFSPVTLYQKNFSFIPTVSALAINPQIWQNNGGPLYNVLNDFKQINIEKHLPNYSLSPFDAIYGPHTFNGNEEHVYISQGLIKWALEELLMGDYENHLTNGSNAGNAYNFGDLYFNRLKSITVNQGCSLNVFINDDKGYKNITTGYEEQYYQSKSKPDENSIFHLYTTEGCSPVVVKINNEAVFELGDGKTRKAITHFRKGSTLELMEGATLKVNNGSVLIIEKGAKIIYHKGANIILDGPNAVLQIEGELVLPDGNTKFTFSYNPAVNNGYVHFLNAPTIKSTGLNNTIELYGAGIANKTMQISGGELHINGTNSNSKNAIANIILQNGMVEIDMNSALKTDAPISCSFVNFTGINSRTGNRGLVLFGQSGINLTYCKFQNLMTGLEIQNYYNSGTTLVLEHNLFNNCETGAYFVMMPMNINYSNFLNCGNAIYADYNYKFKVENTSFTKNITGINFIATNGLSGVIKTCSFKQGETAVKLRGKNTSLTIACTDIRNCTTAVYSEGRINMSKLFTDVNYGIAGGDCNLLNNDFFFVMDYGSLDIVNGFNNIIHGNVLKPVHLITGTIDISGVISPIAAPNYIDGENNYWYPNPAIIPTICNFNIITSTASYIGAVQNINPISGALGNCYYNTSGGGNGDIGLGDLLENPNDNVLQDPVEEHGGGNVELFRMAEHKNISVYPVPANNNLQVAIEGLRSNEINNITLINFDGKELVAAYEVTDSGTINLNSSELPGGTYLIVINTNKETYRKRFIVVH